MLAEGAVDHPHVGDHAAVLVELGVEDQGPRRAPRARPSGAGMRATIASSTSTTPSPVLAEIRSASPGSPPSRSAISAGDPLRLGAGQVDLVDHRDQLQPVLDRQVGVGDGLRLDPLGGVDDQQRALAGGEAARDLVGEVDVAGRVDQVQVVGLAVGGLVLDPHRLGLDRDPALALEVHRVEHLGLHFLRVDGAGELEDAVGQGRLAVVDVGDDREVADVVHRRGGVWRCVSAGGSCHGRGPRACGAGDSRPFRSLSVLGVVPPRRHPREGR